MLSKKQLLLKRVFDITLAFIGLLFLIIPILFCIFISSLFTQTTGIFGQVRVGQHGNFFTIYKIRTMRKLKAPLHSELSTLDKFGIAVKGDKRLVLFGKFLRKYKLDELPQLFNVLIGNMSFVGPRPDLTGYADKLIGKDRKILEVKPGITGPATLAFKDEEQILSQSSNPLKYNNEVIWPQKVKMNIAYIENWSLKKDIYYIFQTIFN